MNKSVLEILELALNNKMDDKSPKMLVLNVDRVLGKLKSPIVPKLLNVIGHFGFQASQLNQQPDIGIGMEAIFQLIDSELVREYGNKTKPDEQLTVRRQNSEWIVVAVSKQIAKRYTPSSQTN